MTFAAIEAANLAAFGWLNAGQTPAASVIVIAQVFALGALYAVMAALVIGWVRGGGALRFALLDATLAALTGLALAVSIASIWYHPRPFAMGLGVQLLPHAADGSFPSDHGTLLFGLAFPLLAGTHRRWGLGFLALALAVAWARIYLGVHFPLDMLGAALVAGAGSVVVWGARNMLHSRIYPGLSAVYEVILRRLHLPCRLFPRAG